MKIITTRKRGKKIYFQFLGIPFCVKIVNKYYTKYKKYYFNGIIKAFRVFRPLEYYTEHQFYLFDLLICRIYEHQAYKYYYLCNKLIKKISIKKIIEKKYIKRFKKNDYIYILNANSGEIYLFLTYCFDELRKKHNAKTPIFAITQNYHEDMVKAICPDIPYFKIKTIYRNILETEFTINGHKLVQIFPKNFFYNVEQEAKNNLLNTGHYLTMMYKLFDINPDNYTKRIIHIPPKVEESMLKKIQNINLNLEKFIFIAPEANSCKELSIDFWKQLIFEKQKEGFDIFINICKGETPYNNIPKCKKCCLSYNEAFVLARRAKKIYALRSGFVEFLLQTEIPMEVYYTPFKNNTITAEQIHSEYTLLKIPEVNSELITEKIYS